MTAELIIISESGDESTNKVLEYLNYSGYDKYIRLNAEDNIKIESIEISESGTSIRIRYRNKIILFNESKVIWYRRGDLSFNNKVSLIDDGNLNSQLNHFLKQEWVKLRDFILSVLPYENSGILLGNIQDEIYCNKPGNLIQANKSGMRIPKTFITSSKEHLKCILNNKDKFITKPISNIPTFQYENQSWSNKGNTIVLQSDIENLEDHFSPLLVQEYIEKAFEIRVFYFCDKLFPMAIFSQSDIVTSIDYRNYNLKNPNRAVPLKLSDNNTRKIINFINITNTFSGSIDFIQDQNGELYFLEINYFGQFDWLSHNCNYYIEEYIAEYLLSCTNKNPCLTP